MPAPNKLDKPIVREELKPLIPGGTRSVDNVIAGATRPNNINPHNEYADINTKILEVVNVTASPTIAITLTIAQNPATQRSSCLTETNFEQIQPPDNMPTTIKTPDTLVKNPACDSESSRTLIL